MLGFIAYYLVDEIINELEEKRPIKYENIMNNLECIPSSRFSAIHKMGTEERNNLQLSMEIPEEFINYNIDINKYECYREGKWHILQGEKYEL